jgi:hypothetical protein
MTSRLRWRIRTAAQEQTQPEEFGELLRLHRLASGVDAGGAGRAREAEFPRDTEAESAAGHIRIATPFDGLVAPLQLEGTDLAQLMGRPAAS